MKSSLMLLTGLLILSACKLTISKDDDDDIILGEAGTCTLRNSSLDKMMCITYGSNYSDSFVDSDCDAQRDEYAAEGAVGLSTSLGPIVFACTDDDRVGTCRYNRKIFHYYDSEFTAGQAQSDCTSMGGTFQ